MDLKQIDGTQMENRLILHLMLGDFAQDLLRGERERRGRNRGISLLWLGDFALNFLCLSSKLRNSCLCENPSSSFCLKPAASIGARDLN